MHTSFYYYIFVVSKSNIMKKTLLILGWVVLTIALISGETQTLCPIAMLLFVISLVTPKEK